MQNASTIQNHDHQSHTECSSLQIHTTASAAATNNGKHKNSPNTVLSLTETPVQNLLTARAKSHYYTLQSNTRLNYYGVTVTVT